MEELVVSAHELPEAVRAWLEQTPALVVVVERLPGGEILLRPLADVDPAVIARVRVAMARYRETLMNLT